jgi:predicted lipid-binding transport protein (Tim44 family)
MKKLLTIVTALIGFSVAAIDADARRLGGGGSFGKQRQSISPQQAAPKAPAQQQQPAATTGTPAQQPAGASRWLGPLAGLALGAGLASLFLNNGFAGGLAGLLMIMALIAAAAFVMRMLRAKSTGAPIQYAGAGEQDGLQPPVAPIFGGAAPHSVAATTRQWPAGFDAAEFARHAKLNFVNLQAAHDRKDLSAMRDFMTPALYEEIEANMQASNAPQQTDVVTLDAEVLDVATEGDLYVVSVRFSGLIREAADQAPQEFSEIWHLDKPVSGDSGWLVSGIQQN